MLPAVRMKRRQALNLSLALLVTGVVLIFISWVLGSTVLWIIAAGCFIGGFYFLFARMPARPRRRRRK
jgi:4-hydroxybenzoate polyprenyltransferase